ncbi:methyltransferase domain-containing protein [Aeromicrobium sp. Leaf350]|uniref:methyltransferase domain-containing protein n=1 Tax=Aeromicrobium sp. Leaf350 TaxID=2876565 RepID=UPI001E476664|nr:methyltransferase domain-containing protein [Aeromicrobium sp. Leaf350]
MTRWDPSLYLQHAGDRGRPFVELLARVPATAPARVLDLGCGAGNLSSVIRDRWPGADVLGVGASEEMIAHAREVDPDGRYEVADVNALTPDGPYDVIVSNAMFQWLPDAFAVITRLLDAVQDGGAFAVQVPDNQDAPSHRLMREVAARPAFADHTQGVREFSATDAPAYLELFAGLGWTADVWTTEYLHVLEGDDAVWGWVSGTGARPYVQALPDGLREQFVAEYQAELRAAYPQRDWGTVFPFARTFAVATRPDR